MSLSSIVCGRRVHIIMTAIIVTTYLVFNQVTKFVMRRMYYSLPEERRSFIGTESTLDVITIYLKNILFNRGFKWYHVMIFITPFVVSGLMLGLSFLPMNTHARGGLAAVVVIGILCGLFTVFTLFSLLFFMTAAREALIKYRIDAFVEDEWVKDREDDITTSRDDMKPAAEVFIHVLRLVNSFLVISTLLLLVQYTCFVIRTRKCMSWSSAYERGFSLAPHKRTHHHAIDTA